MDSERTYLAKSLTGVTGVRIAGAALGVLSSIALARLMGPAEFGRYAFVVETLLLVSSVVAFGFPLLLTRDVARYRAAAEYKRLRGLLQWSGRSALVLSFAVAGLTALLVLVLGARRDDSTLFLIGLPITALGGLGQLRTSALRGLRQPVRSQVPESIMRPALTAAIVASVALLTGGSASASTGVVAMASALAVGFAIGSYWLWRAIPDEIRSLNDAEFFKKRWTREAWQFFLLTGVTVGNSRLMVILAGAFLSSEEVAFYKVSVTASTMVSFLLVAGNVTIAPWVSEMYKLGEMEKLQRMLTRVVRVIFAAALVVGAIFVVFGRQIIQLFYGPEYAPAYIPLVILTIGQMLNSAAGPVGPVLNMSGHQSDTLKGRVVALAGSIGLALILIPRFGPTGAALSAAVGLVLWNLILLRFLHVRTQLRTAIH